MTDWISGAKAAEIIGSSRAAVWRTLVDEKLRAKWWGDEGVGWRTKPMSSRGIYQVNRERAEQLAGAGKPEPS